MFRIRHSSRGELFISFSMPIRRPNLIHGLGWMSRAVAGLLRQLDTYFSVTTIIVTVSGIGLGLGLSLTLYHAPTALRVFATQPTGPGHSVAFPLDLQCDNSGYYTVEGTSVPLVGTFLSSELHAVAQSPALLVVGAWHQLQQSCAQLELGDSISVKKTNNGVYYYTITEVKTVSSFDVPDTQFHDQTQITVVVPTSALLRDIRIITAR